MTDIYLGALLPVGLLLVLYIVYVALVAAVAPGRSPPLPSVVRRPSALRLLVTLILPVTLIVAMLALIIIGFAYTVEAAAAGAVGATLFAVLRGELSLKRLDETMTTVIKLSAMVFMLLIGVSTFTLVFRGFSGDLFVTRLLAGVPGGADRRGHGCHGGDLRPRILP
jgi:TRAP-type mannitol/chloroaromatic compound transport system permease large subunit